MVFHTLGHQDELNAAIGIASEYCALTRNGLQPMLIEIQSRLFDLGAAVATPAQSSPEEKVNYTKFNPKATLRLEEWIDRLDAQLPPLTNFVIPVSTAPPSKIHVDIGVAGSARGVLQSVPIHSDC
jgi:cob(I)alamin adenosyltransferase